jgi:hypothetical protein
MKYFCYLLMVGLMLGACGEQEVVVSTPDEAVVPPTFEPQLTGPIGIRGKIGRNPKEGRTNRDGEECNCNSTCLGLCDIVAWIGPIILTGTPPAGLDDFYMNVTEKTPEGTGKVAFWPHDYAAIDTLEVMVVDDRALLTGNIPNALGGWDSLYFEVGSYTFDKNVGSQGGYTLDITF